MESFTIFGSHYTFFHFFVIQCSSKVKELSGIFSVACKCCVTSPNYCTHTTLNGDFRISVFTIVPKAATVCTLIYLIITCSIVKDYRPSKTKTFCPVFWKRNFTITKTLVWLTKNLCFLLCLLIKSCKS